MHAQATINEFTIGFQVLAVIKTALMSEVPYNHALLVLRELEERLLPFNKQFEYPLGFFPERVLAAGLIHGFVLVEDFSITDDEEMRSNLNASYQEFMAAGGKVMLLAAEGRGKKEMKSYKDHGYWVKRKYDGKGKESALPLLVGRAMVISIGNNALVHNKVNKGGGYSMLVRTSPVRGGGYSMMVRGPVANQLFELRDAVEKPSNSLFFVKEYEGVKVVTVKGLILILEMMATLLYELAKLKREQAARTQDEEDDDDDDDDNDDE
jgi:hypothetical protein